MTALSARGTLLTSGLATIALGLVTTAVLARARARKASTDARPRRTQPGKP